MKRLDYKDLYFGVTFPDWNGEFKRYSIFRTTRVIRSIYYYRKMLKSHPEQINKEIDPLYYCFGDLQGRIEWEMMVGGMGGNNDSTVKVDVYNMFIVPNREHLLDLVRRVTMASLKREMKELKGYKLKL